MSLFTLDKVMADARSLGTRLKDQENVADGLLTQTQELSKKVDSMKMYQENLDMLHEMARHRPPAELTIGIFQENSEISELDHENAELRQALDEHQSAIELIMSRYRHQVTKLISANRLDRIRYTGTAPDLSQEVQMKVNQISKMADVMWSALATDNSRVVKETELLAQARVENATLRDLLTVGRHCLASSVASRQTQTDSHVNEDADCSPVINDNTTAVNSVQMVSAPMSGIGSVSVTDTASTDGSCCMLIDSNGTVPSDGCSVPIDVANAVPTEGSTVSVDLTAHVCSDTVLCDGSNGTLSCDSNTVSLNAAGIEPCVVSSVLPNGECTMSDHATSSVSSEAKVVIANETDIVPSHGSNDSESDTVLSSGIDDTASLRATTDGNEVSFRATSTVPCDVNTMPDESASSVPFECSTVSPGATSTADISGSSDAEIVKLTPAHDDVSRSSSVECCCQELPKCPPEIPVLTDVILSHQD
jgi:hypothetical protein